MFRLFLSLVLLFTAGSLSAQVAEIPTGQQPAQTFFDERGILHVFTLGVDNDFDGELDTNDVGGGWYRYDERSLVDSTIFDGFFNSFPLRIGFDRLNDVFYAPLMGRVMALDARNGDVLIDTVTPAPYQAVTYDSVRHRLYLSMRAPDFTSAGQIDIYDLEDELILGFFRGGVNPQMGEVITDNETRSPAAWILNEGGFQQTNASFSLQIDHHGIYQSTTAQPLGATGTDLLIHGSRAYVALNGDHRIRVIETGSHGDATPETIDVGTADLNGPRRLALQGDSVLLVTTYAGDLRRFSLETGLPIDTILLPGRAEGIGVRNHEAFIAITYKPDTYDADSLVAVVDLVLGVVVDTIKVGAAPEEIVVDRDGAVQVFGRGTGGDPTAWWSAVSPVVPGDTMFFHEFGDLDPGFPHRVAYDSARNEMATVMSDTFFLLDPSSPSTPLYPVYTRPEEIIDLFNVADAGDYWLVTHRPNDFQAAPNYISLIDKTTFDPHLYLRTDGEFIATGAPIESDIDGVNQYYILHEGNFGSATASLSWIVWGDRVMEGELGGLGNHLTYVEDVDHLIATMNGTDELVFVSPTVGAAPPSITQRVDVGSGPDGGARATAYSFLSMALSAYMVASYDGSLHLLSGYPGSVDWMDSVQLPGRAEYVTLYSGDTAYIPLINHRGSFEPGSTIAVVGFDRSSVPDEPVLTTELTLRPQPARERATVSLDLPVGGVLQVDLHDAEGRRVQTLPIRRVGAGEHEVHLSLQGLTAGTYFCRVSLDGKIGTARVVVVR